MALDLVGTGRTTVDLLEAFWDALSAARPQKLRTLTAASSDELAEALVRHEAERTTISLKRDFMSA